MSSALSQAKSLAKYNNELEKQNVKLQYQYNKSLANDANAWSEKMANSAHQREIKDLKAAGLNPVLSVTGGSGSATPTGSSASVSKPNVDMSLPRAVMDMAMAQLNSATSLQTTAMMNAATLENTRLQGYNQIAAIGSQAVVDAALKGIPSGDSKYGQFQAYRKYLHEKLSSKFPDIYSRLFDDPIYYGPSFRGVPINSGNFRKTYTDIDALIADLAMDANSANKYDKKVSRQKRWNNRKEEFKSNFTAANDVYNHLKKSFKKDFNKKNLKKSWKYGTGKVRSWFN